MKILSRRAFIGFTTFGMLVCALPRMARAVFSAPMPELSWEILEVTDKNALEAFAGQPVKLTGYLKQTGANHYMFSRLPYHCDYCYLGDAASVVRVKSAAPLKVSSVPVTLEGKWATGGEIFPMRFYLPAHS